MGSPLTLLEQGMIRTINEHHRAAKRLFALAENAGCTSDKGCCSLRG